MRAWFFCLIFTVGGCHTYAPVEVRAYDAETQRPLEGITVEASSRYFADPFHPKRSRSVTNDQGVAVVEVCTNYASGGPDATLWFKDLGPHRRLDHRSSSDTIDVSVARVREQRGRPLVVGAGILTTDAYRRRYGPE